MAAMPRDTKTRFDGVYARHKTSCTEFRNANCPCRPSYWGKAWDRYAGKHVKTAMLPSPIAAKNARADLIATIAGGVSPAASTLRVSQACERFLRSAEAGVALNKHGRRFKPSAVKDLRSCYENYLIPSVGTKRVEGVRRADIQTVIDAMVADGKSGSRVRSVVNATRTLYGWLQDHEHVHHDPAARVRLPAMDATPRDRVATPAEALRLLDALPYSRVRGGKARPEVIVPGERFPFLIAFFTGARRAEIRHAVVDDLDLTLRVVYLGADEAGRKSRAAQRAVPIVPIAVPMFRRALLERGQPAGHELLCPGDRVRGRNSGMISFEAAQARADRAWAERGLVRITAHECRHTFASWLDAAGVRPAVASQLMGHSVARDAGGAAVTKRYTHTLPGDLERARDQLAAYIAEQLKVGRVSGAGTG